MNVLDKSSPVPLYYQLKEIVLSQIRKKVFKPGDSLPPERVLCEKYGLARMTVRQALNLLVDEGYLSRKQGSGTFVSSARINYPLCRLRGFTEEMTLRGLKTTSSLIDSRMVKGHVPVRKKLGLCSDEPLQMIKRVRLLKNEPFAVETNFIPEERCPGLLEKDLTNASLYFIYENEFKIHLKNAIWTIETVLPVPLECRLLGIKKNQPLLLLEGVTYDINDKPVEFVKGLYRSDRYKFSIEMAR